MSDGEIEETVAKVGQDLGRLSEEVRRALVGQSEVLEGLLVCLIAGGHVLLEGVPGLGKTMLVRSVAQALQLDFSRIQFTPDLMPADIIGTTVIAEAEDGQKHFEFRKGPVFANIVLADEINRATPKTQSALLEVMQEHSVTVGNATHQMEQPYFVMATQNPLEMEGTYPLPEAQLDRFFFKLHVAFPSRSDLHQILERTTGAKSPTISPVLSGARVLEMRAVAREIPVPHHVQDYAIRLLQATHPGDPSAPEMVRRYVRFGGSPRGVQACLLAAKIYAMLDGRYSASTDDVRRSVHAALRHRIILSFEGEAEGIACDDILSEIVATIPEELAS